MQVQTLCNQLMTGNFITNYFCHLHFTNVPAFLTEDCLIFLLAQCNEHKRFYKAYFVTQNINSLQSLLPFLTLLSQIFYRETLPIVFEVIVKGVILQSLQKIFLAHCRSYSLYERLRVNIRDLQSPLRCDVANHIHFATLDDKEAVYNLLYQTFDAYRDNLPNQHQIIEYINNKQVLCSKSCAENNLQSLLIWTTQGKVSHFNYLINTAKSPFTMPQLIQRYYQIIQEQGIKQVYLWVDVLVNARLRQFYIQRYGYRSDNTFNHIFIFIPN